MALADELLTRDELLGTSLKRVTYSAVLEASNSSRREENRSLFRINPVIFNAKARERGDRYDRVGLILLRPEC